MRKLFFSLVVLLFVTAPHIDICSAEQGNNPDVTQYLPAKSDLTGWTAVDEPQIAQGEDLYLLIDGAAEIFLEYGFKHTVSIPSGRVQGVKGSPSAMTGALRTTI